MRTELFDEPLVDFHERAIPAGFSGLAVWEPVITTPTIVLGSSQKPELLDAAAVQARGLDVVRRRSGGGAVHVDGANCLWLDVVLGKDHPQWTDDVRSSVFWLGEIWREALAVVGIEGTVHTDGLESGAWGRLVCFAGAGPGEVMVGGRKVVGIAQRRTAAGARFQCAVYATWEPAQVVDVLALPEEERARARTDIAQSVEGVGPVLPLLREAFLARLDAAAQLPLAGAGA